MIDWSILSALESKITEQIFVSSDSKEIIYHAQALGVRGIERPKKLLGETPIIEVYRHAVVFLEKNILSKKIDTVIGLQPDHPDRTIPPEFAMEYFSKNKLDQLFTCDANGTKNGSYYIISRRCLDGYESRRDATIIDNCTNIHFFEDLAAAELNIHKKDKGHELQKSV